MSDYQLYLGDCMDFMQTLAPWSVDSVVTDPPYLNNADSIELPVVTQRAHPTKTVGMPWGYSLDWIDEVARLEPKQWIVFCNHRMIGGIQLALEKYVRICNVFIWKKSNAPNMIRNMARLDCEFVIWAKAYGETNIRAREFKSSLIEVPMPQAGCFATERVLEKGNGRAAHPSQKPLGIVLPFIDHLTEENYIVFDPFTGTGTTGVACMERGRRFIGCERDAGYYAIAEKRIREAASQPLLFST